MKLFRQVQEVQEPTTKQLFDNVVEIMHQIILNTNLDAKNNIIDENKCTYITNRVYSAMDSVLKASRE